jgi:hypothetical protein
MFVELIVPELSVTILPVVMFAVIAVKVEIKEVRKDDMFPVMLVTVVDPRVEEPVVNKFPNAPIPVFVDEPMFSDIAFPF